MSIQAKNEYLIRKWVNEEAVCWQRGPNYPWTCDAIIGHHALAMLCELASHASPEAMDAFRTATSTELEG